MKKFIKNLSGCIPFRRHRKKNRHSSSLTIYLPDQKENAMPETLKKIHSHTICVKR